MFKCDLTQVVDDAHQFSCAKMRKLSYNNAGVRGFLGITVFGTVRSCHGSEEANNF